MAPVVVLFGLQSNSTGLHLHASSRSCMLKYSITFADLPILNAVEWISAENSPCTTHPSIRAGPCANLHCRRGGSRVAAAQHWLRPTTTSEKPFWEDYHSQKAFSQDVFQNLATKFSQFSQHILLTVVDDLSLLKITKTVLPCKSWENQQNTWRNFVNSASPPELWRNYDEIFKTIATRSVVNTFTYSIIDAIDSRDRLCRARKKSEHKFGLDTFDTGIQKL